MLRSVVIVGGGTAGWITAGVIAAAHQTNRPDGLKVTLLESPTIGPIGVGEGTWPTMRSTLKKMGIAEADFIRDCDATFKQGAKFAKWTTGADDDFYYHPLMLPQGFARINLAAHWQRGGNGKSFSEAVCLQEHICERGLAPKQLTTPEYQAVANYAYHLDAAKFAPFVRDHCTSRLGVRRVLDDMTDIVMADNGDIAAVKTKNSGEIEGDLFIDCTGFSALLLGKQYDAPFVDRSNTLFIDAALAVQVPYEREDSAIASQTISTAQDAGWIWDIGLSTRRGIGYVYSSRHTNDEEAERALSAYIGPAYRNKGLSARKIPIRSGHRRLFWKNNCVAVGLSAGFLEPLEASAIVLVELSASFISDQLPARRDVMDIVAKRFNQMFEYRWDRIIDFLKLHYILSQRTDTQFWIDNRDPASIPESLQELLRLWRFHHPWQYDFTQTQEVFPSASYQYILYGMGFRTEESPMGAPLAEQELANSQFKEMDLALKKAVAILPRHRDLIDKIRIHGLQKI